MTRAFIGVFIVSMIFMSGSTLAADELAPSESISVDQLGEPSESESLQQDGPLEALADESSDENEATDAGSSTLNQNTCSASVSATDLKDICAGIATGDKNIRSVIKAIGENPNLRSLKSMLEQDTLPRYARVAQELQCGSGASSVSDRQLTSVCGDLTGALRTVNSFALECSGFSPICATAEAAWRMYKPMTIRGIHATEAESNCQCVNAKKASK